jgi:hypothetical protein
MGDYVTPHGLFATLLREVGPMERSSLDAIFSGKTTVTRRVRKSSPRARYSHTQGGYDCYDRKRILQTGPS